jgi:hypothetical protein
MPTADLPLDASSGTGAHAHGHDHTGHHNGHHNGHYSSHDRDRPRDHHTGPADRREHADDRGASERSSHAAGAIPTAGLARMAFFATLHCLMGCAVGEVLGLVIGTALGWGNVPTTALAVGLAFAFGYAFTIVPLHRRGMNWREAARLALAADTASIAVMEIVDNGVMWLVPGAMDASPATPLFWGAMALALAVALVAAWPLNAWLLARGRGHALVHDHRRHP